MAVTQSLTLTENEVFPLSNSSKVRILWKSTQTGESWNGYTRTAKYYVSINGEAEKEYSVSYTLPKESTTTIVDTIITVGHKPDGSGNVTVRTWMDTGISAGVVTKTESLTLTTIPRETTLDSLVLTGGNLEGIINVNYTPKNLTFYNKYIVYVNVNKLLTQICTDTLSPTGINQQTYNLKFDADARALIYSKVTNSASATIRVTIQTYSDSTCKTKIGSDQSREITVALPTSVSPTVSLNISPVNTNPWIDSKKIYVAGFSSATVKFVTATPGEGSSLRTKGVYWDGVQYGLGINTSSLNISELKKGDNIEVVGYVTDNRMRYAEDVKYVTVHSYDSPAVTSMTVERGTYNNGWTSDENGEDVKVEFKTTLSLNAEGNVYTAAFKIDNKEPTQLVGTISGLKSGVSRTVYFVGVDREVSHTLKLTATDSVGNAGVATITIPTTHITVEYKSNGKGIAFGKTSEEDAFECAWPAMFSKGVNINGYPVADFVIEEGTNDIWTYRKWYSGLSECWGAKQFSNLKPSVSLGSVLVQDIDSSTGFSNFPQGLFSAEPSVWLSLYGNGAMSVTACGVTQEELKIRVIDFNQGAAFTKVYARAVGKWK